MTATDRTSNELFGCARQRQP